MFYSHKGDEYNLERVIRVSHLKDWLRFGYKQVTSEIPAKKWFFGLITVRKAISPGFYKEDWLNDDLIPTTEEKAVYDGRFVRVWFDPERVMQWNYGEDFKFQTEEEALSFIEAVRSANSRCKFDPAVK